MKKNNKLLLAIIGGGAFIVILSFFAVLLIIGSGVSGGFGNTVAIIPVQGEITYSQPNMLGGSVVSPVSYTHLDVYKRQLISWFFTTTSWSILWASSATDLSIKRVIEF